MATDPQERGGASVDVDRLSQIKRRIREWRSYDAATQDDDQDWLVTEVERLQEDLAQKRKDIDYLLEMQKGQLARADKLIDDLAQARAERDAIQDAFVTMRNVADGRKAQADELRAENKEIRQRWATEEHNVTVLRAEVERLRTGKQHWQDVAAGLATEIDQLRAASQVVIDSINDENEIDPDAILRLSEALARPER
jgi:chromosome segregation ATPase